eukprot:3415157-Amphidinium_carterae.1
MYGGSKYLVHMGTASAVRRPVIRGVCAGCPLAVFVMGLATSALTPSLSTLGVHHREFVDDITIWATGNKKSVEQRTCQGHHCLTEWAHIWGLSINNSKTRVWSTHAPTARAVRKSLERPENDAVREVKDLGLDVLLLSRTRKQHPIQGQRLTEAISTVERLRASTWSQHELSVGIPATVYARALWGCELHRPPPNMLTNLKSAVYKLFTPGAPLQRNQDLVLTTMGSKPYLSPEYAATARMIRFWYKWIHDCPDQHAWLEVEWRLARQRLHVDGASHYLFHHLWQALATLNWHPTQLTSWRTSEGRALELMHITPGAFMHEVRRSIQKHAAHEVQSTRQDFGGLDCLARVTVMKALAGLAPIDRQAVQFHMRGGGPSYSEEQVRHGRSNSCPFCGHADPTHEHQLWRCSVQPPLTPSLHNVLSHPHQLACLLQRGIILDTFPWMAFNLRSQKQRKAWAIGFYQQLAMRRRNWLDRVAKHRESHPEPDGELPVAVARRTRTARPQAQHAQYLNEAAASASAS